MIPGQLEDYRKYGPVFHDGDYYRLASYGERHQPPGGEGRHPSVGVAGAGGHVGPHGGQGIDEGRALLDAQAVNGVGVVGGPDLGAVVQHARVEPPAAAAAVSCHDSRTVGKL